jgi:hypothetical protein
VIGVTNDLAAFCGTSWLVKRLSPRQQAAARAGHAAADHDPVDPALLWVSGVRRANLGRRAGYNSRAAGMAPSRSITRSAPPACAAGDRDQQAVSGAESSTGEDSPPA